MNLPADFYTDSTDTDSKMDNTDTLTPHWIPNLKLINIYNKFSVFITGFGKNSFQVQGTAHFNSKYIIHFKWSVTYISPFSKRGVSLKYKNRAIIPSILFRSERTVTNYTQGQIDAISWFWKEAKVTAAIKFQFQTHNCIRKFQCSHII